MLINHCKFCSDFLAWYNKSVMCLMKSIENDPTPKSYYNWSFDYYIGYPSTPDGLSFVTNTIFTIQAVLILTVIHWLDHMMTASYMDNVENKFVATRNDSPMTQCCHSEHCLVLNSLTLYNSPQTHLCLLYAEHCVCFVVSV